MALALLASGVAALPTEDPYLGRLSFGGFMRWSAEGMTVVAPSFSYFGDAGEAKVGCTLSASENGLAAEVGETWLRYYVGDFLSIEVGRFSIKPGSAIFLTNLSLLAVSDPTSFLGISLNEGLSDQIEVRALGEGFFASFAWSPFFVDAPFPETDPEGAWFPTRNLPETISYLDYSYRRRSIEVLPLEDPGRGAGDFMASAGISAGSLDVCFLLFQGRERTVALLPTIRTRGDLDVATECDILLTPRRATVSAIGASARAAFYDVRFGGVVLGVEGLCTQGRSTSSAIIRPRFEYENDKLVWYVETADYTTVDELATTASVTWTAPSFPLSLFAEGRMVERPWADPRIPEAAFARMIIGGLRAKFFNDRLELLLAGGSSISGGGSAFVPSLSFGLLGESSFSLQLPFFFGDVDSELGQYRDMRRLFITFETRF